MGLSLTGRNWEMISKVSNDLVERLKKPYGVMMGVLEERDGVIRVILVSNYKGLWDFIWLSYDMGKREWSWVPLPEFRTKGLNMAGIALSSGLTL
ncbi:hypothetical protein GIB67_043286 [Kingdonia uniflora]|uniref:Uncharacterized protein n=1 Tax=Kingdonia uniflora TaxID=39325 RepID=A0A7J7M269_9MAGN|nr:hypothetical protein GIB67_043286 [Kingdonia uniflora]